MESFSYEIMTKDIYPEDMLTRATSGSVGFDLRVCTPTIIHPHTVNLIPLGIRIKINEGYEGQIRMRSGLSVNEGLFMVNGVGTIDQDYEGELKAIISKVGPFQYTINKGDRIAQLVINKIDIPESMRNNIIKKDNRGYGGFGHSGT